MCVEVQSVNGQRLTRHSRAALSSSSIDAVGGMRIVGLEGVRLVRDTAGWLLARRGEASEAQT